VSEAGAGTASTRTFGQPCPGHRPPRGGVLADRRLVPQHGGHRLVPACSNGGATLFEGSLTKLCHYVTAPTLTC